MQRDSNKSHNDNEHNKNGQQDEFIVYPKRFLIVTLFGLSQFMVSVLLNTLNPIAAYLCIIYGQDPVVVNLGGLLFTLMHPIFTFPASYIIDTFGTRVGIGFGCSLAMLGVSMRMLVNQNFMWVIAGQVVAGIGRPFIMNCQAKISGNWFSATSRGGVTQLLTLILNISLVIGILIPGFIFSGYAPDQENPSNIQQGKDITKKLMFIQTLMGFFCFLPNLFLQANQPPTPPSASGSMKREPFNIAIPSMLKNRNFILLLVTFGCFFGIFNALSIIISYLIQPFFDNDSLPLAVAAVGGSPVISGILGVIIIGPLQRREKKYKKWIIICICGSTLAIVLFYPLLLTHNLFLVSFISAFNSFFLIPLVPIILELGCELVFPVGEGSAVGMLFAVGNFSGFLLGLVMSVIVKGESQYQTLGGLGFCFGIFILGLVIVYFLKEQKNREKAESEYSNRKLTESEGEQHQQSSSSSSNEIKDTLLDKNNPNKEEQDSITDQQ